MSLPRSIRAVMVCAAYVASLLCISMYHFLSLIRMPDVPCSARSFRVAVAADVQPHRGSDISTPLLLCPARLPSYLLTNTPELFVLHAQFQFGFKKGICSTVSSGYLQGAAQGAGLLVERAQRQQLAAQDG